MRSLLISLFTAVLLTACSAWRPVSQAGLSNDSLDDYQHRVEAMSALEREADLVLAAKGIDCFSLWKPAAATEQFAVGPDGYLRFMPKPPRQGSSLVVLVIPQYEIVQGTEKIMDEVILDVRDVAVKLGYRRFAVGIHAWGQVAQIYTDGLPSREQVAEKKRSWKEIAARWEKENTK